MDNANDIQQDLIRFFITDYLDGCLEGTSRKGGRVPKQILLYNRQYYGATESENSFMGKSA